MLNQISRYYHTLKYLKWIQIKYQLRYRLMPSLPFFSSQTLDKNLTVNPLAQIDDSIMANTTWLGEDTFRFLNISHAFKKGIDWNYDKNGKLWTYNLTYFEFLSQPNISKYEGLGLIHDFIAKEKSIKDGMESFPISLRMIFWIKFLLKNKIQDDYINASMYRQFQKLSAKPEYHLLGNHLLENGFSLFFGGVYFDNKKLQKQGEQIITEQLQEQILEDGAHFELSPMYHQIILYRVLDSLNLVQNYPQFNDSPILNLLQSTAAKMLGWLHNITFTNGDMACVNDSIEGIAPSAKQLFQYAENLKATSSTLSLQQSGYRKFSNQNLEALIDVGKIGPDYIPGHAHSDTFNFILYKNQKPIIVDTGISTYEKNARRNLERSTSSHNTVMVDGKNQSEVWGGFRVARRANVSVLEESENYIKAQHNGYQRINCIHQRNFQLHENSFDIKDELTGEHSGIAFLHFHPDVNVLLEKNIIKGDTWNIKIEGAEKIELHPYFFAKGFNQTTEATKAIIHFKSKLHTTLLNQ